MTDSTLSSVIPKAGHELLCYRKLDWYSSTFLYDLLFIMLLCFVCNYEVGGSLKALFIHLRNIHGIHERNAKYSCRQGQCCRSFSESMPSQGIF